MSDYNHQMSIGRDIDDFMEYVKELRAKINAAGCLWNDPKYFGLKDSVSRIASDSREIIGESDRLCYAITQFMNICSEEFL